MQSPLFYFLNSSSLIRELTNIALYVMVMSYWIGNLGLKKLKQEVIMKRQEYRSILGQLPIKNPTPDDVARICPHLTGGEASAVLAGNGFIAIPPLRVRKGYQTVAYYPEWVEQVFEFDKNERYKKTLIGTKNHPACLDWSGARRTRESYMDSQFHGDYSKWNYRYMEKAMKFAEDNWGQELVYDSWKSSGCFYIQDPTDLVNDCYYKNHPRTKAVLYITFWREFDEIRNDESESQNELFDQAIMEMTLDRMIYDELKGGRGGFISYNCAHCGGGLDLTFCTFCRNTFSDNHFRCGWRTPLSRKMVNFLLENGHKFGIDPEKAMLKDNAEYEKRQADKKRGSLSTKALL